MNQQEITPKFLKDNAKYLGEDVRTGAQMYQFQKNIYKVIKNKVLKMPGSENLMGFNNY